MQHSQSNIPFPPSARQLPGQSRSFDTRPSVPQPNQNYQRSMVPPVQRTPVAAPTSQRIPVATPTSQRTPVATPTFQRTPVATPTAQRIPVPTPTTQRISVPAPKRAPAPTVLGPQAPTQTPTYAPTQTPTYAPTQNQTYAPTQTPAYAPTQTPAYAPTQAQGGILRQFEGVGSNVGVVTVTGEQKVTAAPLVNIVEETGYSILRQLAGLWDGTEDQIGRLSQLRYTNGNYIVDPNRRDVIMEIVGMLIKQGFDNAYGFLSNVSDIESLLWEQKSMDSGRDKVVREITIQQAEDVGVKGVGKCKYCPSTELVFATKQLRSGDEPATIFVRCVMCSKQWRQ